MTSPNDQSVSWKQILAREHLPKIALLAMALWLHSVNSMLSATTLPSAVEEIGGLNLISWAFALYLMGSIIAAASTNLAVATLGLRKAMLFATAIYIVGCTLCAMDPVMPVLLVGRVVQGLGGGGLMALVFIAQDRFFPNHFVPKVVACLSVVWTLSAFCGPLIGGAFATYGLWRMAFWAFFVQGGLLIFGIRFLFKKYPIEADVEPQKIPIVRLGYLAIAILAISLAGAHFHLLRSSILIIIGFASIGFFLARDRGASNNRMLPLDTTNLHHRIGSGITMTFVLSMSIMSFLVYGPLILISLYDLTPLTAGFVVMLEALGWGGAAVIFSGVQKSKEPSLIRIGSLLVVIGLIALALALPHGPLWLVIICTIFGNSGFGMMWGFIIRRIVDAAAADERDRAGALIPSVQQMGFALGAALSGLIANGLGISETMEKAPLQNLTFWLFASFVPLGLVGVLLAWRFTRIDNDADGTTQRTLQQS
ncbi:MAG: MFS transporter [Gammaproteobacteria bacterium]|nr:MFS transporter [Gammaproteobacteria bacterium]